MNLGVFSLSLSARGERRREVKILSDLNCIIAMITDDVTSTVESASLKLEQMQWFDETLFNVLDDHNDPSEHATSELDRYFESGQLYSMIDEEETVTDGSLVDDDDAENEVDQSPSRQTQYSHILVQPFEEAHLSQSMSQLSMTNTNDVRTVASASTKRKRPSSVSLSPDLIPRKVKRTEVPLVDHETMELPDYLSANNRSFDQAMTPHCIDIDQLRRFAQFKHHIAALEIYRAILMLYARMGTGTIEDPEFQSTSVDRHWWPTQVKSMLLSKRATASPMNVSDDEQDDEYLACLSLVEQRLKTSQEQIVRYQGQLDNMRGHLLGFTSRIERAIEAFVDQHGIWPLRMKRDLKMALVQHDYRAEMLERRYTNESPNAYQVGLRGRGVHRAFVWFRVASRRICTPYENSTRNRDEN